MAMNYVYFVVICMLIIAITIGLKYEIHKAKREILDKLDDQHTNDRR